jgi:hypothetical protein
MRSIFSPRQPLSKTAACSLPFLVFPNLIVVFLTELDAKITSQARIFNASQVRNFPSNIT